MSDYFYEEGLLCQNCENKIGVNEKYLEKFLFKEIESEKYFIEKTNSFSIIHLNNVDCVKYKIGLICTDFILDTIIKIFFVIFDINQYFRT